MLFSFLRPITRAIKFWLPFPRMSATMNWATSGNPSRRNDILLTVITRLTQASTTAASRGFGAETEPPVVLHSGLSPATDQPRNGREPYGGRYRYSISNARLHCDISRRDKHVISAWLSSDRRPLPIFPRKAWERVRPDGCRDPGADSMAEDKSVRRSLALSSLIGR